MRSPGKDLNAGLLLGDWPLPIIGGRLHSARNPNQGSSAVGSENTGKETGFNPLFGVLFKHQRLEALSDTPALEQNRIT